MCSVEDEDAGTVYMPIPQPVYLSADTTCWRCTSSAWVVLRKRHPYCQPCLNMKVTHKFRSCLGKSKQMRPTDRVLVGFSGSDASRCMLHMLYTGKQEEDHKKLMYKVIFCYVDDGEVLNQTADERQQRLDEYRQLISSYGFEFHSISLSAVFEDADPIESNRAEESLAFFGKIKSLTSREDALLTLRQRLLVRVAERLQCNRLFTAESQTKLAGKLLTSIALGRGEQLSRLVGFSVTLAKDVTLMRPMMDVDDQEIRYYNTLHNLTSSVEETMTPSQQPSVSIKQLTQTFLSELLTEFPNTVSTVFRTGEKLTSTSSGFSEDCCLLCHGEMAATAEFGAAAATAYSHQVSVPVTSHSTPSGTCQDCTCKDDLKLTKEEMECGLCYGCLLIIKDLDNLSALPSHVKKSLKDRLAMRNMKDQISQFLL